MQSVIKRKTEFLIKTVFQFIMQISMFTDWRNLAFYASIVLKANDYKYKLFHIC